MKLLITATVKDAPIDGANRRSWEGEQHEDSERLAVKDWHGDDDGYFDTRGEFRSIAVQNGFTDVSFIVQDEKHGDVEVGDDYDLRELARDRRRTNRKAKGEHKEESHATVGVEQPAGTDKGSSSASSDGDNGSAPTDTASSTPDAPSDGSDADDKPVSTTSRHYRRTPDTRRDK